MSERVRGEKSDGTNKVNDEDELFFSRKKKKHFPSFFLPFGSVVSWMKKEKKERKKSIYFDCGECDREGSFHRR